MRLFDPLAHCLPGLLSNFKMAWALCFALHDHGPMENVFAKEVFGFRVIHPRRERRDFLRNTLVKLAAS
jgi:hypothetical protein